MMIKSANSLEGIVNYSGDPVSIEDMNDAIAVAAAATANMTCVMCGGSIGLLDCNGDVVCEICNASDTQAVKPTNQA